MPVPAKKEVDHEGGPTVQEPEGGPKGRTGGEPEDTQTLDLKPTEGKRRKSNIKSVSEPEDLRGPSQDDDAGDGLFESPQEESGGGETTEPQQTSPQQGETESDYIRRMLAEKHGFTELSELDSEEAALEYLAQAYGAVADMRPVVDEYLKNKDAFEEYQRSRQPVVPAPQAGSSQSAAQQPPATPGTETGETETLWNPPSLPPDWKSLVTVHEETGMFVPKEGVDPEVARQANARAQYLAGEYERFWEVGPHEYLRPAIEERAREIARQEIESVMQTTQRQSEETGFFEANKDWMFKLGEDGLPLQDRASGMPLFTDQGRLFRETREYLANQYGIQDAMALNQLAVDFMQRAQSGDPGNSEGAAEKRDQKNKEILAKAGRKTNAAGTKRPQQTGNSYPSRDSGLGLQQRLRESLQGAGLTDADLS